LEVHLLNLILYHHSQTRQHTQQKHTTHTSK
jgi:hypothetical protein